VKILKRVFPIPSDGDWLGAVDTHLAGAHWVPSFDSEELRAYRFPFNYDPDDDDRPMLFHPRSPPPVSDDYD
jgi:hypothetical protein